ncbi:hypothetical protein ACWC1C_01470 [Streptomyces sp. NPDC001705]
MAEPAWNTALRAALDKNAQRIVGPSGDWEIEEAMAVVLPHIDAAYKRGLAAGRSQAGYRALRKRREEQCETDTAGAAGSTPALPTGES